MDIDLLAQSPLGELVPIHGHDPRFAEDYEHYAFVPAPLPPEIPLSSKTFGIVVDASTALARADQAASVLPNPGLLARPATRREAVSTSALEGTYAAIEDVFEADFLEVDEITGSVREVRNYVEAADRAYALRGQGAPISIRMLEDIHAVLLQGTTSDGSQCGSVRTTQVFIGVGNGRVTSARFVPPPPDHRLRDGLVAWADWIRGAHHQPTLVRMAAAHYQFEALHPFHDGNGRIGRLVAVLQLMAGGDLEYPVLNISPWLEQHRADYQHGLFSVSATGQWDEWIELMCRAIKAESEEVVKRVDRLLALRESFKMKLQGSKGVSLRIADDLIGYPMITATLAAELFGVSYQSANTAIAKLVEAGILRQRTRGRYARIFQSVEVLRALEY